MKLMDLHVVCTLFLLVLEFLDLLSQLGVLFRQAP
jgi:hypothetical protein